MFKRWQWLRLQWWRSRSKRSAALAEQKPISPKAPAGSVALSLKLCSSGVVSGAVFETVRHHLPELCIIQSGQFSRASDEQAVLAMPGSIVEMRPGATVIQMPGSKAYFWDFVRAVGGDLTLKDTYVLSAMGLIRITNGQVPYATLIRPDGTEERVDGAQWLSTQPFVPKKHASQPTS